MFQAEGTACAKPRGGEKECSSMGQELRGNYTLWRRYETVLRRTSDWGGGPGMSLGIQTGRGWHLSVLERGTTRSECSRGTAQPTFILERDRDRERRREGISSPCTLSCP